MSSYVPAIGVGFYSAAEAARLLKVPARNVSRWLGGYSYNQHSERHHMPPLWTPQLPGYDHHIELGFRDLIELRFVKAFIDTGLGLKTIRFCLDIAREYVNDERPFSTRRFRTDGRTIFLESARIACGSELLDLKRKQYTIKDVIKRTFKDLDVEADAVARWRPYSGKETIVIDPERAFGQPIAADYGIPTITLAQAVEAEGTIKRVTQLYEVPAAIIKEAVSFEKSLLAA